MPPPSLLELNEVPVVEVVDGEVLHTRVVEAYLASVKAIKKGNKQLILLEQWLRGKHKLRE